MKGKEIIEEMRPKLDEILEKLKEELRKIRIGRPPFEVISEIKVEYFGKNYLLKQLATISFISENQIVVEPWDRSYLTAIEKALSQADLGLTVRLKEEKIFLIPPPLSREYKEKLIKLIFQKKEVAKRKVRDLRKSAWGKIQDLFLNKEISEDEKYRSKDELQKVIDSFNEKIEKLVEEKEKEIKG